MTLCGVLLVSVFLASSLYFHARSRVRFKLRRQLTDYSTLLAPYNAFACVFAAGPSRPIHDVRRFAELTTLRANWQAIRDEARALLETGHVSQSDRSDDVVFYSFFKRGWKRFYLAWYAGFLPSARQHCPRTVELLEAIPYIQGAMFALIDPGGKLGKHRDPFAGVLRYHLGLITPNSSACSLQVDDQEYVWRDGEDILFDSSYVHRADNKTDTCRLILFCDVERPMCWRPARWINRFVMRHVLPLTATANFAGEHVGAANRLFTVLQPARRAVTGLKRISPVADYALKFALFVGVPVLLVLRVTLS